MTQYSNSMTLQRLCHFSKGKHVFAARKRKEENRKTKKTGGKEDENEKKKKEKEEIEEKHTVGSAMVVQWAYPGYAFANLVVTSVFRSLCCVGGL